MLELPLYCVDSGDEMGMWIGVCLGKAIGKSSSNSRRGVLYICIVRRGNFSTSVMFYGPWGLGAGGFSGV